MQRHRITVVVPERALAMTPAIAREWTYEYGGATVTRAQGWWNSEAKGYQVETVDQVAVLVDDDDLKVAVERAEVWARHIKETYGEEAVLITVEREVAYKLV